jgi:hypothetical protein
MSNTKYPILISSSRNPKRVAEALDAVANAVAAGQIRNVDLKDIKTILGRAAEEAWEKTVSDPYFYAGRFAKQSDEVQALSSDIMIMGLHSVSSTAKKVSKTRAEGPAVQAMMAYCEEVLPLAEAVASLKNVVVKGRAAPDPEKLAAKENPNKVVKTCACCFRGIAVKGCGTMANHGYKRPQYGWQTKGCPGDKFKPLEVSSDGLRYMVTALAQYRDKLKDDLASIDTKKEFPIRLRLQSVSMIGEEHPRFEDAKAKYVAGLANELRGTEEDIPMFERKLEEWKPQAERIREDSSFGM